MAETFILFKVGEASYAVRSMQVQKVAMVEQVTRVPNAPAFVEGVVFERGEVLPVINMRRKLGLEAIPYDLQARLIIIRLEGRPVALAVDAAREFLRIEEPQVSPLPESLHAAGMEYLEGAIQLEERLVLLVDLQRLLDTGEQALLSKATLGDGEPVPEYGAGTGRATGRKAGARKPAGKRG